MFHKRQPLLSGGRSILLFILLYHAIVNKTIRHIRVGNYILIYEVIDENRMIHILRFRYAKMDFTNMDMK